MTSIRTGNYFILGKEIKVTNCLMMTNLISIIMNQFLISTIQTNDSLLPSLFSALSWFEVQFFIS